MTKSETGQNESHFRSDGPFDFHSQKIKYDYTSYVIDWSGHRINKLLNCRATDRNGGNVFVMLPTFYRRVSPEENT